jgi:hypothetical protein
MLAAMSTWHDLDASCPACGAKLEVKVATGLHISRLPEIREQVLRGELHRFECAACKQRIEVRRPLVYADFERGHWIEVRPADAIGQWRDLATACAASFTRVIERGSPLVRAHSPQFLVRLVFGYDELREKVVLWDAGLDDVAVECLKLLAIRRDPAMFGAGDRLLVTSVERDTLALARHRDDRVDGTLELVAAASELVRIRGEVEPALAERFADPFVSINRMIGRYAVMPS